MTQGGFFTVETFEYAEIVAHQQATGDAYLQFLNQGSMSLGLYVLPAGSVDTQTPHLEDEIYYVVSGRGAITVDGERREVQPGSIVFVAKDIDHRFVNITEDLSILVFFAPQHTRN
ncbi:MAG: cupin domain-containing protein [Thermomicrobiales bacterium]